MIPIGLLIEEFATIFVELVLGCAFILLLGFVAVTVVEIVKYLLKSIWR